MKVVGYVTEDDVPEGLRAAAYVLNGANVLGIRFNGRTVEEARQRAAEWLEAEQARVAKSAAGIARQDRARAAAAKEAAGDTPAPKTKRRKATGK